MSCQILHGDCRDVLPTIGDATIDAIVTDPPYELGFMGKRWDASGIAYDLTVWRECLRVLKPGGHLLAFGGTRTYHRMACAIEDAGFEVRDSIHWLYGSGFPKSLDVSKAIDKMDARDEQQQRRFRFTEWVRSTGVTARQIDDATGTQMGNHYTTHPSQPAVMTTEHLNACRHLLGDVPQWVEHEAAIRTVESQTFASREVVGTEEMPDARLVRMGFVGAVYNGENAGATRAVAITAPATDAARQWEGWGTALKPAHEPIIVARKPLDGTVAANVLKHGTGAINVDGCRVGDGGQAKWSTPKGNGWIADGIYEDDAVITQSPLGRWPANVVIDQHVAEQHPEWANYYYCAKASTTERNTGLDGLAKYKIDIGDDRPSGGSWERRGREVGGAVANTHPTVKPLALMRWLVRLVTPPDGTVLDPFAGSGTTLTAAILEHRNTIGIELTDEYHPIIQARTTWAQTHINGQLPL